MMDYKELIEQLKRAAPFHGIWLRDRILDATTAIETLLAERDAAIADIENRCETCKHFVISFNGCTPDYDCDNPECRNSGENIGWEWRGPQKEDKHEAD